MAYDVITGLMQLTAIAVVILAALLILAAIACAVIAMVKAKKSGNRMRVRYDVISIVSVLVAAASWLLNFGWIRFIMTLRAIPFIHAILFFFVNHFAAAYVKKSRALNSFTVLSYVFYMAAYLCLPDGGDIGPLYVFFGQFHSDWVIGVCNTIAAIGFAGSAVCLVLQLIFALKTRKRTLQNENVPMAEEKQGEATEFTQK